MSRDSPYAELSERIVTQPHILEMIVKSSLLVSEKLRQEYVNLVDFLGNQIRSMTTSQGDFTHLKKSTCHKMG